MSGARAEVGDLVRDGTGREAIVTDIKQGKTWVLRPPAGVMTRQWETEDPDSLHVLETRMFRLARERGEQ
ncbi:hypothetical protein [Streptomyces sp. H27-C3]|uniref:hypothetical protein n=1 Tax=Streptomyces sp. H27-C3 TaxID=3046305 RepID=UPI0024BA5155|nr:hypothetical protein [Streptomyces sp. H27-C3]MDJ0461899.1 hypothetical protein [Streptomyces sp. H27-C3]